MKNSFFGQMVNGSLSLQLMAKLDSFSIGKQKSSKRKIDAELRDVLRIAEAEVRLRRGTDGTFSLYFLCCCKAKKVLRGEVATEAIDRKEDPTTTLLHINGVAKGAIDPKEEANVTPLHTSEPRPPRPLPIPKPTPLYSRNFYMS